MNDNWQDQAYYQALSAAQLSGSQDHDRAILTLSSATLALSATFIHDIAKPPIRSMDFIVAAWGALVAAIILMVISFQVSQWAMQAAMQERATATRLRTGATVALNLLADGAFVAGLILFAMFARENL